jgi:hypothetical protein
VTTAGRASRVRVLYYVSLTDWCVLLLTLICQWFGRFSCGSVFNRRCFFCRSSSSSWLRAMCEFSVSHFLHPHQHFVKRTTHKTRNQNQQMSSHVLYFNNYIDTMQYEWALAASQPKTPTSNQYIPIIPPKQPCIILMLEQSPLQQRKRQNQPSTYDWTPTIIHGFMDGKSKDQSFIHWSNNKAEESRICFI